MGLDLRNPIGLMFAIMGLILCGYGVFSDKAIYQRSLGININLIWGLVLLVFGAVMMLLAKLAASRAATRRAPEAPKPVDGK